MRSSRTLYVIITAMFLSGIAVLPYMPNPTPIHWNAAGAVDGYGSPLLAVMLAPLIALAVVILMPLMPKLDPRHENYTSFQGSYKLIMSVLVLFFALIHGIVIGAGLGWPISIPRTMMLGMGVMFGLIGNELGRVQPNYFVGIRTPWTLANPEVWRRTHRMGGRMLAGAGVLLIVLGLFAPERMGFGLGIGAILAASLGSVVYSYWIWRQHTSQAQR